MILPLTFTLLIVGAVAQTCQYTHDDYRVSFQVDCNDRAHFTIQHDLRSTVDRAGTIVWSGVGFGMGRSMRDIDFTQLNVDTVSGKVSIVDMRVSGFTSPRPDRDQDFTLDSYSIDGTVLNAKFSRPIKTNDDNADLSMAHDMVMPHVGGKSSSSKSVSKHKRTPKIIKGVRVTDCKRQCPTPGNNRRPVPTAAPVAQSLDRCVEGVGAQADARWCGTYFNSIRGENKCETLRVATRQLSRGCKYFRCKNCNN